MTAICFELDIADCEIGASGEYSGSLSYEPDYCMKRVHFDDELEIVDMNDVCYAEFSSKDKMEPMEFVKSHEVFHVHTATGCSDLFELNAELTDKDENAPYFSAEHCMDHCSASPVTSPKAAIQTVDCAHDMCAVTELVRISDSEELNYITAVLDKMELHDDLVKDISSKTDVDDLFEEFSEMDTLFEEFAEFMYHAERNDMPEAAPVANHEKNEEKMGAYADFDALLKEFDEFIHLAEMNDPLVNNEVFERLEVANASDVSDKMDLLVLSNDNDNYMEGAARFLFEISEHDEVLTSSVAAVGSFSALASFESEMLDISMKMELTEEILIVGNAETFLNEVLNDVFELLLSVLYNAQDLPSHEFTNGESKSSVLAHNIVQFAAVH